jgi:hypothetical protein
MSSWSYRGTALDTLGIVTLVSDSLKMPERRGENILIPFQEGRIHVEKEFEQRSMTLGLEVTEDSIQALETAMDVVKTLFGKRSLGALAQTLEDLSVRTGQAEYTGDLNLSRISPVSVRMALDFMLPNPFFYSDTLTTDTQTINASPKTYTVTNPGSADKVNPKIVLTGPLSSPEITNVTNGVKVKYNAVIASPRVVTIDIDAETGEFTALDDLGANVIGNLSHEGSAGYFVLDAGANSLSVTDATHTTGTVGIQFYAAYL